MKIFLVFCLLVISLQSFAAEDYIGRVTKLRGNVVKIHGTNQAILKLGDNLYAGDEIHTQKGSFIKVIMRDDTVFQLGAKSSFKFGEFSFKSKKDRHAVYELMQGKLRSIFTIPAKKGALKLTTPTASMGIRGTEILSDVYKLDGVLKTDIALLRGKLDVEISEKTFSLKPGQMIEATKFNINSERAPMPAPSIKEIPQRILTVLKLGERKGGNLFLHDAQKGEQHEMKDVRDKEPEFKPEIQEKLESTEFQAPPPGMNDSNKSNEDRLNNPDAPNSIPFHDLPNPIDHDHPTPGPDHPPKNCREDNTCPSPAPPHSPPPSPPPPPPQPKPEGEPSRD